MKETMNIIEKKLADKEQYIIYTPNTEFVMMCHQDQEFMELMNKSDISQYVSGKVEPNQRKLFVLGKALNVSEAWLMGYDVSRERNNETCSNKNEFDLKVLEVSIAYEKADLKTQNNVRFILDLPLLEE